MRIPKERYYTLEYMRAEWERMWTRVWLWAGHVRDLPVAGTYFVLDLGRESIIVSRAGDGRARAFHNVCQHRGNRLCSVERGAASSFRCGYHHWQWSLDGGLLRMSRPELFAGADPESFRLSEIRCEERHGFVWVNLDPNAAPLAEYLGEIDAELARWRPEQYAMTADHSVEIACNWKLSSDVNNEAYHLRTLHPQLMDVVDDTMVRSSLHGAHSAIVIPVGEAARDLARGGQITEMIQGLLRQAGIDPARCTDARAVRPALFAAARARAIAEDLQLADLGDEHHVDKFQYYCFPNVQLNFTLRTLEVYRHRPHAQDPEICFFDEQAYERVTRNKAAPARPATRRIRHGEEKLGPVMDADVDLLPGLQRGMRSAGFGGLTLGAQEDCIRNMHRMLDHYLDEAMR